ncbi:hypothetical protein BDV93DRAFT_564867 [Ceratobasidium sp. AG-I]|nr:hypothetical protein BDV93DRAFT_564867 [Ceratobasidium sp. AG-I]
MLPPPTSSRLQLLTPQPTKSKPIMSDSTPGTNPSNVSKCAANPLAPQNGALDTQPTYFAAHPVVSRVNPMANLT